jgi:integrase
MVRRGSGDGSIYPRKDGRWVSYLRLPEGRKKFFYGDTRADVKRQLEEAQQAARKGVLLAGPNPSVAEYFDRWLEAIEPSVRPRTFEVYSLNARRLTPLLGRCRLRALEPAAVQGAYAALLRRGLSKRSVEQAHTVLHRALRQAVMWDLIARNPTDAVTVPRPKRRDMQVLTEEQIRQLFEMTAPHRLHALWVVLATTGLRIGEALALGWEDVDLRRGRLSIRRALQRQRRRGLVFVEPKSDASRRTVPLPAGTRLTLVEHRDRQERQAAADPSWNERGLVFINLEGRPIDPTTLCRPFHTALERAGLPRLRIHDLRHTVATYLLGREVHPKIVQSLLGHSTITLTLDTYSHVIPSFTQEAARHMDTLFGPVPDVIDGASAAGELGSSTLES